MQQHVSTMRTLTVAVIPALFVAALFIIAAVPLAAAEDVTIPIGKDQRITDNIQAHLIQVSVLGMPISNENWVEGGPENYLWPTLYYYYENTGTADETGHLTIRFKDDKGDSYKAVDAGTMDKISPGRKSGERTLTAPIPKDRKLVSMTVIKGFDEYPYELTYPSATAVTSPTSASTGEPATGTSTSSPKLCLGSWFLPLLVGGVVVVGTGIRVSRKDRK